MTHARKGVGVVGLNLRRLRGDRELTTRELAKAARVSRQTIVSLELGYIGHSNPKVSTLRKLSSALECDLGDLLEDTKGAR